MSISNLIISSIRIKEVKILHAPTNPSITILEMNIHIKIIDNFSSFRSEIPLSDLLTSFLHDNSCILFDNPVIKVPMKTRLKIRTLGNEKIIEYPSNILITELIPIVMMSYGKYSLNTSKYTTLLIR